MFLYYALTAGDASKTNVCEGQLTLLRSRVVGNKNLFAIATQLRLGDTHSS